MNSISQTKRIDAFCRAENDARKKNLEDVNEWIREENEKRMREAEALKVRPHSDMCSEVRSK